VTQPTNLDISGLENLREQTRGDASVRVAVIDGRIDVNHPCFDGARWSSVDSSGAPIGPAEGPTSDHGTYVASIIAGQPGTDVEGIAPGCSFLAVPAWTPERSKPSQLDLARAIEAAVHNGVDIINLSGGELVDVPLAQDHLTRAVKSCRDNGVLLIAAAGNDGCPCLHVPASLDGVIAVGSKGEQDPSDFSNHHENYLRNGLSAPGENITGARIPRGTQRQSGTSAAAPVVTGVAALLLSRERAAGRDTSPLVIGQAILDGAEPCAVPTDHCRRLLGRSLNIEGAIIAMEQLTNPGVIEQSCGCGGETTPQVDTTSIVAAVQAVMAQMGITGSPTSTPESAMVQSTVEAPVADEPGLVQSGMPVVNDSSIVYAIGALGFDFGTEARRDTFKQLMPPAVFDGVPVPPNPYDARQLVEYLRNKPSEANSLIWTLNLELTPIYALKAVGPYAIETYQALIEFLAGGNAAHFAPERIDRISVPGRLSAESVRLFSGQIVPVIELDGPRGLYAWQTNRLIETAIAQMGDLTEVDGEAVAISLRSFLDRVYYELRNLGRLSSDRALNFSATNVFQATRVIADAVASGLQLDSVEVDQSPYARPESDAWDVKVKFFDPENLRRARQVFRFTIDVSDTMPVSMGDVRMWSVSS
jgi:cyanobactin maturation PatA/PatG family protease